MGPAGLLFALTLFCAALAAANGRGEKVSTGLLVPPFLLGGFPDFDRATIATGEFDIVVVFGRRIIRIAHVEL